jgi:hypothetical protein
MERESTGTKYVAANCEGSQSPPRAVELKKKKRRKMKKKKLVCNCDRVSQSSTDQ